MPRSSDIALAGEERVSFLGPQPAATLDEALLLPPSLQMRLAAWFRVSGQFDRASVLLDAIADRAGETAGLMDERAALALARRDIAAVRACWQRRLASHPAPSARASFARALLELGELDEAAAIGNELAAEHGELATVRALVAEIALQQGDLATVHDGWVSRTSDDVSSKALLLATARIALLGGDGDEARAALDRAVADPAALTPAQLAAAAGLAELLAQPARSQMLRLRYAQLESARAAALAAEIDAALGRDAGMVTVDPVDAGRNGKGGGGEHPDAAAPSPPPETAERQLVSADETPADPRVLETLRDVFGHEALLPGQAAVINRALEGRDTLAILPTGAGKSLTFQLSALLLPGTTLVLSPLIALMKDQVEGLPPALRERTALVNSTLSPAEQQRAVEAIAAGGLKLVYAAPERLRQHGFLRALRDAGVSLVVVDEAHCISLWGHDFRPDYLSIPAALPELGDPPLLAMTATASPETASSLSAAFRRDLDVVRTSAFRPNLFYAAERLRSREEKARRVVALCREMAGQGIVYVSSRKDAENLAGVMRDHGVSAVPYHAGLEPRLRAANQDRFMRGQARVVVATVAFGMGVDKPDVRFIVHFSPSTSLEAYAQESGRAGRDGEASRCVLLYTTADRANQTRLARRDAMDLDTLRQVYSGVKRHAIGSWAVFEPSRIVLTGGPDDDPDELPDPRVGIGLLAEGGLLARHPNAPGSWTLAPAAARESGTAALSDGDAEVWQRLMAWAGLDAARSRSVTIQTAAACAELGITPETLARVLAEQASWEAREGPRLPCFELLPVGDNAGPRLQRVIAAAAGRAKMRVDRMMAYAEGRRCRHADLAVYLGERLPPCGDACDVCVAAASPAQPGQLPMAGGGETTSPRALSADHALAVLSAVRTLPYPMGKTGLTKLLLGSVESRVRADRAPGFGALEGLKKGTVERLIDRLVDDGLLQRDLDHEFKIIQLTERGSNATRDDLGHYDAGHARPRAVGAATGGDEAAPSWEDEELLSRLQEWRRGRAARDSVPAYVVAHNAALAEIVRNRPRSIAELIEIDGFGPVRAERYGAEILAALAATDVDLGAG